MSKITERVDPFSGYLTIVQRDIHLPGNGGLDLDIVRTYNSAIWGRRDTSFPGLITRNEKSPLGYGWSMHMGIVKNPGGTGSSNRFLPDNPVVVMPDGSSHTLYRDKNNSSRFITKEYWRYEQVYSGIWQLTLTDGTRYTFEYNTNAGYSAGGVIVAQATSIEHPNGNSQITIYYDVRNGNSFIDRIQDSVGRYVYFYYDSNDRLTRISGAGINYYYYYTTTGMVPSVDFVLTEAEPPVGNSWQYTYDSTYELNKITYPFGGTIEYTYSDITFNTGSTNVGFRVVTQRTTGGRDINAGTWTYSYTGGSSGNVMTINGPNSFQEVYTYYGWGNSSNSYVWRIGIPISRRLNKSGATILTETYSWDKSASISTDDMANADWTGTGGYVYDTEIYVPRMTSINITRDGKTYSTDYSSFDSYGNPGSISESGDVSRTSSTSYWYNTSNNIVHGKPSSQTISGGFSGSFTTSNSYNSSGDIIQLNKYGVVTNYSYYSNGNLQSETNARGYSTSYGWANGVINQIATPEYTINRSINSNGTIASETNGRGKTTTFSYDGNLRLTSMTPPAGNATTFSYLSDSSYGKETRGSFYTYYYYDGFGRPTGTNNSKGVDTDIVYYAYGVKNYSDSEIGDKVYYDSFERVKQLVHKDGTSIGYSYSNSNVTMTNETGGTTTYTHKAFGDPDEKFLTAVNDPAGNAISYGRNMLGSLTSITQGSTTRSFTYNSKNFLTSENHPETGAINYARDAVGNMTSKSDPSLTIDYTYDGNNRLTRISTGSSCIGSCNSITINLGYDGANNRTSMTGGAASISYTYDSADRLTRKSETISGVTYATNYTYDGNDNITSIDYPTALNISYSYNSNNEMTSVSGFGGSASSFSYNLAGLPTSFSFLNGKSTSISYNSRYFPTRITSSGAIDLGYAYDSRGNTTAQTNYRNRPQDQSLGYDSLDRLTSFSGAWGSGSFSYSSIGNRTGKNVAGTNTSYSYSSSSNRLSSASGGEPASYSYYGNGNMSQLVEAGYTYTLRYDKLSNLSEFLDGGGAIAQFEYDGDGMRVKKITPDRTTIYHYDQSGNVISETDVSGVYIADYVYANGKLVAKVANDAFIIPAAPDNLSATTASSSMINLSWRDNSGNETGFKIERKTGSGGTYSQIDTVGANYSNTSLSAGMTYYYQVKAYNSEGDSAYSNYASSTTFSDTSPSASFTGSPISGPAPLTVTFTNSSTGYDQPLTYAWDFDNSGTVDSTALNPQYTYTNAGTYTVKLTVTDSNGSPNTLIRSNYITVGYTLTINKAGTGSGTVTSSPSGINCGNDCAETYSMGASVTLTALPNAGSQFTGWSGGGCSGTGICALTMNAITTVTATFDTCSNLPVRIMRGGSPVNYYSSVQTAYNNAIGGDIIQSQAALFTESFYAGDIISNSITIEGGYNCNYTAVIGETALKGQTTISKGTNRVKNFVIKK